MNNKISRYEVALHQPSIASKVA